MKTKDGFIQGYNAPAAIDERSCAPAPIRSKSSAVPANDGLRPDNRNRLKDGGIPAIEPNEKKTIGIVQIWSLRHAPAKHVDLLPQDQIFRSSFALDLKSEARTPRISLSRSIIRSRAYPVLSLRLRRIEFLVHTRFMFGT